MTSSLIFKALSNFPLVEEGDDLAHLIEQSLDQNKIVLEVGDILVVAQKIVSKAEGRLVFLNDVKVSDAARELAKEAGKDPRIVELILSESKKVLRVKPGLVIVEHRNGYVLANAGIDRSNIEPSTPDGSVLLLPENADASAKRLRQALANICGVRPGIIVNDSVGRAWRNGTVGIALGVSGFEPLWDQIGSEDLFGNVLEATQPAIADELAAGASFVMGQAAQGQPVILVRGCKLLGSDSNSSVLLRSEAEDLFR